MQQLAKATSETLKETDELLVIGGDHSCAIGTWSGVASAKREEGDLGLIWVDAHMVRALNVVFEIDVMDDTLKHFSNF